MGICTVSGREFNQDVAGAKRKAEQGPVVITDRGEPAFVLMRYEDWRRMERAKPGLSLLAALADPRSAEIPFEPTKVEFHSEQGGLA